MSHLFIYDNIVVGALILIVGFGFHWIGQLISIINWELAERIGLQDQHAPPEYKVYEHAAAFADVAIAWIYGIAGVGLMIGSGWGYKLAWLPGVVMFYHSLNFWFWTRNQRKAGHRLMPDPLRLGWFLANGITGLLAIAIAWNGC